ncbi:hypothetical protein ACC846_38590, partial [Rhizobium ruizarguesonis]
MATVTYVRTIKFVAEILEEDPDLLQAIVSNDDNLRNLIETLNELAEAYDMPIVVSKHPRTHKRMETTELMPLDPRLHFLKP